jgi:hypothetical protein
MESVPMLVGAHSGVVAIADTPCQLGPEGGQHLGACLTNNNSLLVLKASFCSLGDDGAVAIARGVCMYVCVCVCVRVRAWVHSLETCNSLLRSEDLPVARSFFSRRPPLTLARSAQKHIASAAGARWQLHWRSRRASARSGARRESHARGPLVVEERHSGRRRTGACLCVFVVSVSSMSFFFFHLCTSRYANPCMHYLFQYPLS